MSKKQPKSETRLVAGLSYLIVGIIWYLVDQKMKHNRYVTFHVKQALNILIISLLLNLAFNIMNMVSFGIFAMIFGPIEFVIGLGLLVLWIIGVVYALTGRREEIPLVGFFAEKYLQW